MESLQAAQSEISRTYEWLGKRKRDCERKRRRYHQELEQAKVQYVRSPNSQHQQTVRIAKERLRKNEEEYKKVAYFSKEIEKSVNSYRIQAGKLSLSLGNDLPKATASLQHRIDFLKSSPSD